jgi:acyl dehydratase
VSFSYTTLKNWRFEPVRQQLTSRLVILYALAVGYGYEPLDRRQLSFVYEEGLVAAPSLAAALGHPGSWMRSPAAGIDWKHTRTSAARLHLQAPLPVTGTVVARSHIVSVVDDGEAGGTTLVEERQLADANGRPLATLELSTHCPGQSGLEKSDEPDAPARPVPAEAPDLVCDLPTTTQSALLYRQLGDAHPLQADPDLALAAGFERPTLDGLCIFGLACHALVRECLDYEPSRLRGLEAQLAAPAYPGETIRTEIWRRNGTLHFQARALERDVLVLSGGSATAR